ncbi:MAG: IPTL-CTERM sorting domain-containing protein [Acidobacteriota bacterium]|nr:IPTL-CTERM sorting domain-containing protein [Acidobacteriota bacterium]
MLKRLAIVVSLVLLVSVPAFGGHFHGLRITPTGFESATGQLDVDITVWFDHTAEYGATVGTMSYVNWGDGEVVTYSENTYPVYYANETVSAGEWSGGVQLSVYRGSFSHTYETPEVYTIKAVGHGGNTGELYAGYMTTVEGDEGYPAATVVVDTSSSNVPTLPQTGVIVLALGLAGLGAILLRRTATS